MSPGRSYTELQLLILLMNRLTEGKQLARNHPDSKNQSLPLKSTFQKKKIIIKSTFPLGPHPLLERRKGIFFSPKHLKGPHEGRDLFVLCQAPVSEGHMFGERHQARDRGCQAGFKPLVGVN